MSCANHLQNQVGLCYTPCNPGFHGVGPVCWGNVPHKWVDCGLGAAVDTNKCLTSIANKVLSIGEAAIKITTLILTLGSSAPGSLSPQEIQKLQR